MLDNSYYFEPTVTLKGIPILSDGCQASERKFTQWKAEVMIAVTHLAYARSQKIGTGISANTKEKAVSTTDCFFFLSREAGTRTCNGVL